MILNFQSVRTRQNVLIVYNTLLAHLDLLVYLSYIIEQIFQVLLQNSFRRNTTIMTASYIVMRNNIIYTCLIITFIQTHSDMTVTIQRTSSVIAVANSIYMYLGTDHPLQRRHGSFLLNYAHFIRQIISNWRASRNNMGLTQPGPR